jgi:hypothetical protein
MGPRPLSRLALRILSFAVLLTAMTAAVPAGADQPTRAVAVAAATRVATRLDTPSRFYGPVTTYEAVRAMMARPGMASDLQVVFAEAGIPHLAAEAVRTLTEAVALRDVTVAVGTRLEWMALRTKGTPRIIRSVQWGGRRAFAAYEFEIDDGARGYSFVLPTACANLSLVRVGPSAKAEAAARAAEAKRSDDARRAEDARRADAERLAAERAAADAKRADDARDAAARRVEADRLAEESARRADEAAQAAAAPAPGQRRRIAMFIEGLGGKERRVREYESGAATVIGGRCAALVGGKAGLDLRLGSSNWRLAPAIGFAGNVKRSGDSSLLADGTLDYWIADAGFIGSGVGVWDITHSDTLTGSWLLHAGGRVAGSPDDTQLLIVGEGRMFFDDADDVANNYSVWAGLRVVFR